MNGRTDGRTNEDEDAFSEGREVKVTLRSAGVVVRFDGRVTEVSISPLYSGMQCGLCGHYDGDDEEEFLSADMTSRRSRSRFFRSFIVDDDEVRLPMYLPKTSN